MTSADFSGQSDGELLVLYGELMRELKRRHVIRSFNNPVGDIGEFQTAKVLNLDLAKRSCKGFDAKTEDVEGTRYQIKTRSRAAANWRILSDIRYLEEHLFDKVAVVLLNAVTFQVEILFHFPYETAVRYARETKKGSYRITLDRAFLADPGITWVVGKASMLVQQPIAKANPGEKALRPDRTLDDAIDMVLREAGPAGLTAGEIYHRVKERDLYRQKAGTPVTRQQVAKRVSGSRFVVDDSVYPRIIRLGEYR